MIAKLLLTTAKLSSIIYNNQEEAIRINGERGFTEMDKITPRVDNRCSEFTIANREKIITHKLPSINKIERDFNMNVSRMFEKVDAT